MKFSPDARDLRRKKVAQLVSHFCHRWYNAEGQWIDPIEKEQDARGTLWLVFGLLNGEAKDIALANAILARLPFSLHVPARSSNETQSPFDIFVTNHSTQLLVLLGDKLTGEVRAKMESWARAGLRDFAGNRQADYQFHGHNDNMPSKATLGMILGGEYFDDEKAVVHGIWNLKLLRSLLTRRGLLSEYTSGTYLPLSVLNLTEVMLHAQNPEARELAGKCVERFWADVLGHFHSPTGLMGGPYSRSYQMDSTGHLSNMNALLWVTFGEGIIPDPSVEIAAEKIRLVHHHDDRASALGLLAWISSVDLSPPTHLIEWGNQRTYPYALRASAERADGGVHYCPGEINTTHYQEEDYALGTVIGDAWSQLQLDTWFLQYRRHPIAQGPEHVRTGYVRMLMNTDVPSNAHGFAARGLIHVLQEKRLALALNRPSFKLEGQEITSLKLSFVFPTHFGPLEKIEIVDGHVFIQDGPVYLALRGLNHTNWGRKDAIRIEPVENFQQISFYNYEGPARKFTPDELGRTLNGFVSLIGLVKEESFEIFKQRALKGLLVDYFHFDSRVTRYQLGDTLLEAAYGPKADRFRFAMINGALMPRPAWEANGLPADKLPFFNEPPVPLPMEIPFSHLRVIWGPDSPWIIADKGTEHLPQPIIEGQGWS